MHCTFLPIRSHSLAWRVTKLLVPISFGGRKSMKVCHCIFQSVTRNNVHTYDWIFFGFNIKSTHGTCVKRTLCLWKAWHQASWLTLLHTLQFLVQTKLELLKWHHIIILKMSRRLLMIGLFKFKLEHSFSLIQERSYFGHSLLSLSFKHCFIDKAGTHNPSPLWCCDNLLFWFIWPTLFRYALLDSTK